MCNWDFEVAIPLWCSSPNIVRVLLLSVGWNDGPYVGIGTPSAPGWRPIFFSRGGS